MDEIINNRNNMPSQEKENDRPSSWALTCCMAAFFTTVICLIIGTFITCLKMFGNSYVDIFVPLNLIIFTFLGITACYLSLGICLVFCNKRLRYRLKNTFKDILRNYLPQLSIERRYLVNPGKTALERNRTREQENIEMETYDIEEGQNLKPKTMMDIVSQEQLDEIFKDISARTEVLRKDHSPGSSHEEGLSTESNEVTTSGQFLPCNVERNLKPAKLHPIQQNFSNRQSIRKLNPKTTSVGTKLEVPNPKNSFINGGRNAPQSSTDYVSLDIPELEMYSVNNWDSLGRSYQNRTKHGEKVNFI